MVGWHHQLDGHEFEQSLGVGDREGEAWCAAVHGVTKSQTWLSEWTDPYNQIYTFVWGPWKPGPFCQGDKKKFPLSIRDGEENGNPLQYSCLENSMDRGAWWPNSPWGRRESDRTQQLNHQVSGKGGRLRETHGRETCFTNMYRAQNKDRKLGSQVSTSYTMLLLPCEELVPVQPNVTL